MSDAPAVQRPKRADALRNYEAVLAAAKDAFAENGPDASLEEIARVAGVGIGTLYRNFPTREQLINAVYFEEIDQLSREAEAVASLEPWVALETWLNRFVAYVATKKALAEGLNKQGPMFASKRDQMYNAGEPLLTRAQRAGVARTDVSIDDVMRLISAITSAGYVADEQRERVLGIALDGIRVRP